MLKSGCNITNYSMNLPILWNLNICLVLAYSNWVACLRWSMSHHPIAASGMASAGAGAIFSQSYYVFMG